MARCEVKTAITVFLRSFRRLASLRLGKQAVPYVSLCNYSPLFFRQDIEVECVGTMATRLTMLLRTSSSAEPSPQLRTNEHPAV